MITDHFTKKQTHKQNLITEYYELHRSFIPHMFKKVYGEVMPYLHINASRKSCVCLDKSTH